MIQPTRSKSPLRHLDLATLNEAARRETRSRESVLPPVSVFRWWARRTSAVNRGVIEAVATDTQKRLLIADPFAGGGVIPLAALAEGHRVYAQDIDPWAARGIQSMITLPTEEQLGELERHLSSRLQKFLESAYGNPESRSSVLHTFRVATHLCQGCGFRLRLYPYAMVTRIERRERGGSEAFLACPAGHLFRGTHAEVQKCPTCGVKTDPVEEYLRGRVVVCLSCEKKCTLAEALRDNVSWDVVLVERMVGENRVLDWPTEHEIAQAKSSWQGSVDLGPIPEGKETRVLRRHGFERWTDLYPRRQLAVTSKILEEIDEVLGSQSARDALKLAAVGTAEMAGYASRWDRWYLKSYELMARHRFSVTTFAVEPHVWGIDYQGRGTVQRRLHAFRRAARWLADNQLTAKRVETRSIADRSAKVGFGRSDAVVVEGSSKKMLLPSGRIDLILTDPPYHDDIQYSELSALLRAWRGLSTELASDSVVAQGIGQSAQYEDLLSDVFHECHRVLRPGGHMVMSYANREVAAWEALISALDRAGFRGCGFAVVHGENESNFAKRNGGHYTHNLLIDVVKENGAQIGSWLAEDEVDAELTFLRKVGEMILRLGSLPPDWREDLALIGQEKSSSDSHKIR